MLIPKDDGAIEVSKFRPITLANLLLKIIIKIVADRLGTFIAKIISRQQTGFVKRHCISNSFGLVFEA